MKTRKPAAERQAEIVEATVEIVGASGVDRLNLDTVAERVGISQPAIFRHFPTKKSLWLAVAGWIGDRLSSAWAQAEEGDAPAVERLRRTVRAQLKLVQATPAIPSILFSRTLQSENEPLRRAFEKLIGTFHQHLTRQISAAQAGGHIKPELDPTKLATLIMSLVQGTILRWTVMNRRFDLLSEGMELFDLLLENLAPGGQSGRDKRMSKRR